ncbi:MAG: protein translocase subunit SecD [Deltaproteobacteria bacterium]|nr:protein translocase subunit SecD [Deltaproteobacteria bacterium]
MDRALRWKTITLAMLIILSLVYLVPSAVGDVSTLPPWFTRLFSKKVQLGLDLQGGLHTVYGVDLNKAVDDKAGELKRELEDKLAEQKIQATVETPRNPLGAVYVVLANAADVGKVDSKFLDDYDEVLSKVDCPEGKAQAVCLRVSSDYADNIRQSALEQAIKTIKDRVDRFGVAEPTIIKKGDDIVVELPGLKEADIERLKRIIDRTAQLEFKMIDDGNAIMQKIATKVSSDSAATEKGIEVGYDSWDSEETGARHTDVYLSAKDRKVFLSKEEAEKAGCYRPDKEAPGGKYECLLTGRKVIQEYLDSLGPEFQTDEQHQIGYEEVSGRAAEGVAESPEKTWRTYYLFRTAELTGTSISQADKIWDPTTNRPEVLIQFNRHGTRRFGDLTSKSVGEKMAIILDDRITSAPVIQTAITGGRSTITMGVADPRVADREAEDLKNVLRTGALPAPLHEESSSKVGPMLGQDAIDKAKLSMGVGAILVVIIMLIFYRLSGFIANIAMVLNILFQVAILAAFQATLTLPGIAGLVLTIGMAVDSNIIIYERIREELRAGKSIRGAVDAGFSRAFWTVFDAHVTNFVAGFVLLEYGTGPIRGFAVTLLIGVVCTLFTSTWVSRLMFEHYVGRRKAVASISI